MSIILRFQSTGAIPGNGDPVTMNGPSLTIGRGAENDLVLPDPNRELSKRHCAIEDHNGNVIVVDFSTNGTFLNYGKLALGPTPTPINDGDIISVGPYEILINIQSSEPQNVIADPLDMGSVSPGVAAQAPSAAELLDAPGDGVDFIDDLLGGPEGGLVGPGSVQREQPGDDGLMPPLGTDEDGLLPPAPDPMEGYGASMGSHNPAGQDHFAAPGLASSPGAIPDDWDDLLAPSPAGGGARSGQTIPPPGQAPAGATARQSHPSYRADALGAGESFGGDAPAHPAPTGSGAGDQAATAFLKAIGADDVPLAPAEVLPTMMRMGEVMRMMIEGLREILMTRQSIKSEFRIDRTMIQTGGNNPLKFALSGEQAVEMMVKPSAKGYLSAQAATAEALKDIKAHEVAMITGMEAALKGVLKKLDPTALASTIAADSSLSGMLKSKKARYWEIYENKYAEISDQAENDFNELFAKEFARAYQEQLEKLK
ncbi:MAG: type VI secretion system-associated FHA domain protein TagH [Pseudomonadota bacterium]